MKCGLCGHEFTQDDVRCSPACPLAGGCPVVCCPRCGYQTLDESRSALVRLARKAGAVARKGLAGPRGAVLRGKQVRRRARIRRRLGAPSEGSPLWPAQALPLTELRPGQEARVLYIATGDGRRLEQLGGLGIVPDAVVRLLQKRLAAVVQVGETEVALDFGVARQIYVRPLT